MTFDELVSIWHGSAEWWLKAEGDSDYFFKGFVTDMTLPTFLKIRDCEIVNIDDYDLMQETEEQVLILTLRIPEELRYWVNLCVSLRNEEKANEQGDKNAE